MHYFHKFELDIALSLTSNGIQNYAISLGAKQWVNIFKTTAMDEKAMRNWHMQFKKNLPEAHTYFLELLGIKDEEIKVIKQWSNLKVATS